MGIISKIQKKISMSKIVKIYNRNRNILKLLIKKTSKKVVKLAINKIKILNKYFNKIKQEKSIYRILLITLMT